MNLEIAYLGDSRVKTVHQLDRIIHDGRITGRDLLSSKRGDRFHEAAWRAQVWRVVNLDLILNT